MFLAKTVAVHNIRESVDDIAAAETAPIPITATAIGHKYCRTIGSTNTH